jgi:hypothetical protein
MRTATIGCGFVCLVLMGCESDAPPQKTSAVPPLTLGTRHDPDGCGSIEGRVLWQGDVPTVAPFHVPPLQFGLTGPHDHLTFDNPNVPQVESQSGGVAHAVVFLRRVDPERSRPWDIPPVEVEQRDFRLVVHQGEAASHVGFVQRGSEVALVSRQPVFHSLHGDGADFFTLAFAGADKPCRRTMRSSGLVELWSAANYYWMRGYLFVTEHPYYCRTDRCGHYRLPAVPAGDYELVCWMPNWKPDRHHRDPESGVIVRMYFRPPLEQAQNVAVAPGMISRIDFAASADDFEPGASAVQEAEQP